MNLRLFVDLSAINLLIWASTWSVIRVLLLSENSFQMLPSLIASNDIENYNVYVDGVFAGSSVNSSINLTADFTLQPK